MYAFILGNQQMYYDRIGPSRGTFNNNQKIETLEVELKNKMEKVKQFDPESCYNFSNLSEVEDSQSISRHDSSVSKIQYDSIGTSNTKPTMKKSYIYNSTQILATANNTARKLYQYKLFIKYMDIFASILVIIGCILSQIENEDYYYSNLDERKWSIKLINDITNGTIWSKAELYQYNISYIRNNITEKIDMINLTDPSSVEIDLIISDSNNITRIIIAIFTIISLPLIIGSRYLEHIREDIYKAKLEFGFFKSSSFKFLLVELLLILPFQYPTININWVITELGHTLCQPISSILSSITFVRFYFLLKLFKHLTPWTSTTAEHVCEKYVCKADTGFAFKAFQKENPFSILFVIFLLTCICFGLALRNFELYYWETVDNPEQDWNYQWNAMWCIFVAMTTVGYGDFYPKTHLGRFITILACVIGIYFVSMMMVFMTQKSVLNENEYKAFKLITRLKLRREIKDIQAYIVLNALKMALEKKRYQDEIANKRFSDDDLNAREKQFQIKHSKEKRDIISRIEEIKNRSRIITSFEFIPTREHLFDISERIDSDIKEVKQEVESLKFINETIIGFSDSQIEVAKYLKKNCYATKLLYTIIEKKPIFGKLNNVDPALKDLFEAKLDQKEDWIMANENVDYGRRTSNPNSDEINKAIDGPNISDNDDDDYEDNIFNYNVNPDQIREYFDFIFNKNKTTRIGNNKVSKTASLIRRITTKNTNRTQRIHSFKKKADNKKSTQFEIKLNHLE